MCTLIVYKTHSTRDMRERPLFMIHNEKEREPLSFSKGTVGEVYVASLRTGDLVLFTRPDYPLRPLKFVLSELQKGANFSDSEHVGIIYRDAKHAYPYVLEVNWRGEPQLVDFEDRILHSDSRDVIARTLHVARAGKFDKEAQEWIDNQLGKIVLNSLRDQGKSPAEVVAEFGGDIPHDVSTASAASENPNKKISFSNIVPSIFNMITVWWNFRNSERAGAPIQRLVSPGELARQAKASKEEKEEDDDIFYQDSSMLSQTPTAFISTPVARNAELASCLKQYRSTQRRLLHQLELAQAGSVNNDNDANVIDDAVATASKLRSRRRFDTQYDPEIVTILHGRKSYLESNIKKLYKQIYEDSQKRIDEPVGFMGTMKFAPFASTALVADFMQHVGVIPKPPSRDELKSNLQHYDPSKAPTLSNGALDLDRLTTFTQLTAPLATEYFPHNFRAGANITTNLGVFGEEQYVTRYHQKPPHENVYLYKTAFEKDEADL